MEEDINRMVAEIIQQRGISAFRASDKCQREKRKTINGDDLLWAMATLGFEDYLDPLKVYLTRYREGDTKGSAKAADGPGKRDGMQPTPNMQPFTLAPPVASTTEQVAANYARDV
nr:nuclear transcription factor Y subunit B-10-like isoform X1 [Ipomoea batatas]